MSRLLLLPQLRVLPLGRTSRPGIWGLGQDDDEGDFSDVISESDITNETLATPTVNVDYSTPAPLSPGTTLPIEAPAVGPTAPGEVPYMTPGTDTTSSDLSTLILEGQIAPPAGSNLTSAQAQQIAAAGGTPADISAILSGASTAAKTVAALQATGWLSSLVSSLFTPTQNTCPTGYAPGITSAGGSTCVISPTTGLSSVLSSPWLWVGLAAIAAVALVSRK